MAEIRFASREHESFFYEMMKKCENYDSYYKAFFYCMGISDTARNNVGRVFDFKADCIKPDGLLEGWQTGGTVRLTRLAYRSLYEEAEKLYTDCPVIENVSAAVWDFRWSSI